MCFVMIVIASLAVMAILVLAFGRGTGNEARLQNDTTGSVRESRSPQQPTAPSEPSVADNDTLYDVEDFISDYKIISLTKPNSKYYSLTYDIDNNDRVASVDNDDNVASVTYQEK